MVTEEVAREALLSFVNSQCCYSSTAVGNLIIQELRQQTLCRVGGHSGGLGTLGCGGIGPGRARKQSLPQPPYSNDQNLRLSS